MNSLFLRVCIVAATVSLVHGQAVFWGMGDLPGGSTRSCANAVSGDGSVVVGWSCSTRSSGYPEAVRWTAAGGLVGLGDLPGGDFDSIAYGVSYNGAVVVGGSESDPLADPSHEGFRWSGGTMTGVGHLPNAPASSVALDVSADGSVVVGQASSQVSWPAPTTEAYRWTAAGGLQGIGDLPGGSFWSYAHGISADGNTIVGGSKSSRGQEAFKWTQSGGMVPLGDLPGGRFASIGYAVSADASVVVGAGASALSTSETTEACRWAGDGTIYPLGDLPGGSFYSQAQDVSGNGSVIIGWGMSDLGKEAFIWDAVHGIRNLRTTLISQFGLNLTGWTLLSANGISDDGRVIAGQGLHNGVQEGWVVQLPEPATGSLLLVLSALIIRRSRDTRG